MPDYGKYKAAVHISNNDIIDAVKKVCPKFSKIQCSMVSNPDYGVQLSPDAEQALIDNFGFADGLSVKGKKRRQVKRAKTRSFTVRLDSSSYDMVKIKMHQSGSGSAQEFIEKLLMDSLKEE